MSNIKWIIFILSFFKKKKKIILQNADNNLYPNRAFYVYLSHSSKYCSDWFPSFVCFNVLFLSVYTFTVLNHLFKLWKKGKKRKEKNERRNGGATCPHWRIEMISHTVTIISIRLTTTNKAKIKIISRVSYSNKQTCSVPRGPNGRQESQD